MSEPIKAGDLCQVIDGFLGKDSPNIGLIVKVMSYVGDHSKFGRIWRCDAQYAQRAQPGADVPGGMTDFAQAWLKKLPPEAEPPKAKATKNELEHS